MKYSMQIVENDQLNLSEMASDFTVVFRQKGGSLDIKASHVSIGLKGISKARQEEFLSEMERLFQRYKADSGPRNNAANA